MTSPSQIEFSGPLWDSANITSSTLVRPTSFFSYHSVRVITHTLAVPSAGGATGSIRLRISTGPPHHNISMVLSNAKTDP